MRVTLISAGMLSPKKVDHPLARLHLYLNYGLLALASELARKGYSPKVVHGRFEPPHQVLKYLIDSNLLDTPFPVFLSIPSSYAINWSKEFCRLLKRERPNLKIIAGGRWVVGTDGEWIKRKIQEIDLVVYGTAERRVERILNPVDWNGMPFSSCSSDFTAELPLRKLPTLDYSLLDRFEDYQPSVEISRGCGMGCSFCAESDVPLSDLEAPGVIAQTLVSLCEQYQTNDIHPYFEASFFRPSFQWAADFAKQYRANNLRVQWRCESRVDGISLRTLEKLAEAGLKVIDLGLESASYRQLRAMKKTSIPEVYLKRASCLIQECKKAGIWVKINILLYAGEDRQSLEETSDWLNHHRQCIKGLSVGPLVAYRLDVTPKLLESLQFLGASLVNEELLAKEGIAEFNLSREIDYETAQYFSTSLCQEFMSERDYFDLKSFSYLPRSYTFSEFQQSLSRIDISNLPFRRSSPY
jgi:hypothetical protein